MATKYYLYAPDALTNSADSGAVIPIAVDEDIMALYPDLIYKYSGGSKSAQSAPTAYDTLADAQTAGGGNPNSIQPRGLFISVSGFGSAFLPILTNTASASSGNVNGMDFAATLEHYLLGGDTPFPVSGVSESHLTVTITGYRGEQRLAN